MARREFCLMLAMLALSGCRDEPRPEPPAKPSSIFEGLPLSGNLATALAAGFGNCLDGTRGLRCRKDGVMLMGVGPLSAAIDLDVPVKAGEPRFDHVTIWHARDQSSVLELSPLLAKAGWRSCLTPDAERFWRPPSPLRIAIDTNYWGSRRLVISAPPPSRIAYC
ncbi:hypothetical protein [Sphingomonas sp. SRS2]|uniref:hypothetical protein n=1 Tax=Sphingomonas sp. SRS2 TaxID=133190 RepID=UPI000AB488DF|nr:hypothetical protein [Sphingomonas sp. SRS2]